METNNGYKIARTTFPIVFHARKYKASLHTVAGATVHILSGTMESASHFPVRHDEGFLIIPHLAQLVN